MNLQGDSAMNASDIEFSWTWDTAEAPLQSVVKDGQVSARNLVLLTEGLMLRDLHSIRVQLRHAVSGTSTTLSIEVPVHLAPYLPGAEPAAAQVSKQAHEQQSPVHSTLCWTPASAFSWLIQNTLRTPFL